MCKAVRLLLVTSTFVCLILISGVLMNAQTTTADPQNKTQSGPPTVAEAEQFIHDAEIQLQDLTVKASRASWVQSNFITDDTEQMAADANEVLIGATTKLAKQATRYDKLTLPDVLARKMLLLKLSAAVPAPAPSDPKELAEMARIGTSLEADYGKGKYCPKTGKHAGECLDITAIERIMANSTDPDELKDLWIGWRTISPPMRDRYSRWVELGNKGAREMGFKDLSAMWRAGYDMTPEQFSQEVERLWQQVKPLYDSLHAYVRTKRSTGRRQWTRTA
jgi:peptidyl-dipeptidase A